MIARWISSETVYRWVFNSLALLVVAFLLSGVTVSNPLSLILAAIVFGLVNTYIRPMILLLTVPINAITLGLFTLAINGAMLWLTSAVVPGFTIAGFLAAVWAAIVLMIVSSGLSMILRNP